MSRSPAIVSQRDLAKLREPYQIWLTPFWFRVFVAGMAVVAALLTSFAYTKIALAQSSTGDGLHIATGATLAAFLSAAVLWFLNPYNHCRWFRFALACDGLYVPAHKSRLIFVPWSAVVSVDVERWYSKGGEHSAARLTLDLDDGFWALMKRELRIDGEGRIRRLSLQVVDVRGDEIAANVRAYRKEYR